MSAFAANLIALLNIATDLLDVELLWGASLKEEELNEFVILQAELNIQHNRILRLSSFERFIHPGTVLQCNTTAVITLFSIRIVSVDGLRKVFADEFLQLLATDSFSQFLTTDFSCINTAHSMPHLYPNALQVCVVLSPRYQTVYTAP